MIRLFARMFAAMVVMISGGGCGGNKMVKAISESNDGIVITSEAEIKYNEKTEHHIFQVNSTIYYEGDLSIMEIQYHLEFLDSKGNVVSDTHPIWNGQDKPLTDGNSVTHYYGYQEGLDGKKPVKLRVTVLSYKTADEVPPIHLPLPGEHLYQAVNNEHVNNIKEDLPTEIYMIIDHMGAQETARITDPKEIKEIVDLFAEITIAEEAYSFVTDNYNSVTFTFSDGSKAFISLNLTNYEMSAYNQFHYYSLDHFGDFWKVMNDLTSF